MHDSADLLSLFLLGVLAGAFGLFAILIIATRKARD